MTTAIAIQAKKMIYAQEAVARMIACKMTKSKGVEHVWTKIATGFQVSPIKALPSAMPPAKPLPVKKPQTLMEAATAFTGTGNGIEQSWTNPAHSLIELKFRGESPKYVDAFLSDGKPVSFGKSTLISWDRNLTAGTVLLKMTNATAKKRGLV